MRRFSGFIVAIVMVVCGGAAIAQDTPRESNRPQRVEGERRGGNRDRQARPGDRPSDVEGQQRRRGRGQGEQRRGDVQGGGGGIFHLLDVDRDGTLSAKEIDNAVAVLTKLDVNKDGMLDAEELAVRGGGGRGRQGGRRPKK